MDIIGSPKANDSKLCNNETNVSKCESSTEGEEHNEATCSCHYQNIGSLH